MRASYVVSVLVWAFVSQPTLAQNSQPLLNQTITSNSSLDKELKKELEECYILKNLGPLPDFKLRYKRVFKKEILVCDEEKFGRTSNKMAQRLKQMGYLHATVSHKTTPGKKGTDVEYYVELGLRWIVGNVIYVSLDSGVPIEEAESQSQIIPGTPLDIEILESERERVSEYFQHRGFATINEGFIHFELDTSRASGVADVELSIRGQNIEGQSSFKPHNKITIGKVEYDQSQMIKQISVDVLNYLNLLEAERIYDPYEFESTYRRLSTVSAINSVQLIKTFTEDRVDINIAIKSANKYNLSFGLDMTRADTRFGPLTKLTWKNRNLRRKGDVLTWTGTASYSSTQLFSDNELNLIPNTGEVGLQLSHRSIGLPLISESKLPKSTYAHSEFILSGAIESRPEYNRAFANLLYRIDWIENPNKNSKIIVDPIRLSYVNIESGAEFQNWLDMNADPFLHYRFTDYMNLGSSISWSQSSLSKFLCTIEWSGMLGSLIAPEIGFDKGPNGGVELNDVPLIKYLRLEGSWSKLIQLSNESDELGFRVRGGSAWVGKGTEVLPYDRAFFGGGANGVRGWPVRGLGGSGNLIGVGDLMFDMTLEHRREINEFLILALFSDVGNVWTHAEENKLENIAFSGGIGFRFDLEFFLFRIDSALRIYDPTQNQGQRWMVQGPLKGGIHFGLGHPF